MFFFLYVDVKDVQFVFNYDMPGNIEDYVHRIGRTGRAGAFGTAISFFTNANSKLSKQLMDVLRESNQEIPEGLKSMRGFGGGGYGGYGGGRSRGFGGGRGGGGGSRYNPYGRR